MQGGHLVGIRSIMLIAGFIRVASGSLAKLARAG